MKTKRILAGCAAMLMALTLVFGSGATYAATVAQRCGGINVLGTAGCTGYFSNTYLHGGNGISGQNIMYDPSDPTNFAIPMSVASAPDFINFVVSALGTDTSYSYNKVGAAFLVDTMLGVTGGALGNATNAIAYAQAHLTTPNTGWEARINYYAAENWISWNVYTVLGAGTINSLHACPTNITNPACTLSNMVGNPGVYDAGDFAWFNMVAADGPEVSNEIIFSQPGGSTFSIRRECANLIGNVGALAAVPIVIPSCDGFTINPSDIDPNTKYSITAQVSYDSAANATLVRTDSSTTFYLKTTDAAGNVTYNQNLPIGQNGAVLNVSGSNLGPTGGTGTYYVYWGIRSVYGNADCGGNGTVKGPTGSNNPPASFNVADQPYFSVTGGDVSAGGAMSASGVDCAVSDPKAGIVSWNDDDSPTSPNYNGAGTEYAALALNHLQDFATGQGTSLSPTGLSFANTADGQVSPTTGLFGGMFDSLPCVTDYYGTKPASTSPFSSLSPTPGTIGAYTETGPTVFWPTAALVPTGDHLTVYVKGDLYINYNVVYSGTYASVADIPSMTVIVQGNIYIAPGVTQLDGTYIAQPTSATSGDGNIYTCATSGGSGQHPYSPVALNGGLYNSCKTSLTVNGSFIANQVWLLRTAGTVSGLPAETFNFTPESWLVAPYDSSVTGTSSDEYDAITSLPPVL